jgi:hypothetical protein
MFSIIMTNNREGTQHFNMNSQNSFVPENNVEQRLRYGNKRPTSSHYVTCQPSTSKRYRKNTFSSSDEVFEMNSRSSDPYLSCPSNTSSISSSNQSHIQQQSQQQEHTTHEETANSNQRLLRTTEMLKESGLYDVAVRTAALIRQNQQSRKELEELKEETKLFLRDVLNNPENRQISHILNGMQQNQ